MLAGVSAERGVDLIMQFKQSVDIPKFKVFLEQLRARYFFEDICIYFDNLAIHRSKAIQERMDELSIAYIYGPIASPEMNAVEYVFSQSKRIIKQRRLQAIMKKQ